MPSLKTGSKYNTCCGKVICSGCAYAPVYDDQGNIIAEEKCCFCRKPAPTEDESMEREKKRVDAGDPIAIYNQGIWYRDGMFGYPVDHVKVLELWHRAGKLGYAEAYTNIGYILG